MATASILVIDDDAAIQRFIARLLSPEGYTVRSADNAKEGLNRYQEAPADIVITDLMMPDTAGLETIRTLRRLNPDVKIVAISGQSSIFLESARNFGAMDVLAKPFTREQLLEVLEKLLQRQP